MPSVNQVGARIHISYTIMIGISYFTKDAAAYHEQAYWAGRGIILLCLLLLTPMANAQDDNPTIGNLRKSAILDTLGGYGLNNAEERAALDAGGGYGRTPAAQAWRHKSDSPSTGETQGEAPSRPCGFPHTHQQFWRSGISHYNENQGAVTNERLG